MPGVSNHSSASPPSMRRRAPSTWRVVPGLSATSPKRVSRVSVRSSEVLPVLVCPTTAMRIRESAMSGLQPVQRVGGGRQHGLRGQAQRRELRAPAARARTILVRGQQQPDARLRVRGQFGDQRERARPASGGRRRRSGGARRRRRPARRGCGGVPRACRVGRRSGCRRALWPAARAGRWAVPAPAGPVQPGRRRRGQARLVQRSTGGPGRWRPRRVPAGRAAAWPGSAGSMRRPASLRRSTRHSSAAASRAARHRPPPRRSATATIAPGRRPAGLDAVAGEHRGGVGRRKPATPGSQPIAWVSQTKVSGASSVVAQMKR